MMARGSKGLLSGTTKSLNLQPELQQKGFRSENSHVSKCFSQNPVDNLFPDMKIDVHRPPTPNPNLRELDFFFFFCKEEWASNLVTCKAVRYTLTILSNAAKAFTQTG